MANSESQLRRFHNPEAIQTSWFLRLPPELRNEVYRYVLQHRLLIRVSDRNRSTRGSLYHYRNERQLTDMALLQTCQILYTEAASWFCANHVFVMQQASWMPRTGIAAVDEVYGGTVVDLQDLLDRLAPHTGTVCRVSMNLMSCSRDVKFIEVTECLRTIWQSGVSDNLQFHLWTDYGAIAIEEQEVFDRAFRSLQIGAMNVKKYHRAVEHIYIKSDGSGGAIAWGPYGGPHYIPYGPPYDADFNFDDCNIVKFSTTESGIAWESKLPHRAIELMKLPMKIRKQIIRMATLQTYEVDLDSGKRVTHGLLCNDENSLNELRRQYVVDDRTIITMSTTSSKSTFSDFDKLRKIVREDQEVMLYRNKDIPGVQFNLHFKLQDEATLDDLRISILPFIMETSEAPGWFRVEISVFHDRSGEMTPGPTHSITLSTLRSEAVKALSTAIAGFEAGRGTSHIWINGRGEVIGSYIANAVDPSQYLIEKSNLATEVWEDSREGCYRIKKLHTIDADYRSLRECKDYRGLRTCCGRMSCPDGWLDWTWICNEPWLWDRDQLFPFTWSPKETLQYLLWVIKYENCDRSLEGTQHKLLFFGNAKKRHLPARAWIAYDR